MDYSKKLPKQLIESYIDLLEKKFKALDSGDFNSKAKLSLRQEIETMKQLLMEESMETMWADLNKTFGLDYEKPGMGSDLVEDFNEDILSAKINTQSSKCQATASN